MARKDLMTLENKKECFKIMKISEAIWIPVIIFMFFWNMGKEVKEDIKNKWKKTD